MSNQELKNFVIAIAATVIGTLVAWQAKKWLS